MKKLLVGIGISIVVIVLILKKIDVKEIFQLLEKINYTYMVQVFFFQILGTIAFSFRWYYFLEKQIKVKHAISSSFIGYGANMVLPARGGDLFRVYYCRSETQFQSLNLLSKLFIEKAIDFIFVILMGVIAFFFLGKNYTDERSIAIFLISGILVAGILITLYLIRYQLKLLLPVLSYAFKLIKKDDFYKSHIENHIVDFNEFLQIRNFIKPIILTFFFWLFNVCAYIYANLMMNYDLSILEIVFVLFLGAMSLAVPSAPSGLGVFHGAVVSAFILLNRDIKVGLVYATILHLVAFISFTVIGLVFYLYWLYRRRHT